jgi:hypothetical protein
MNAFECEGVLSEDGRISIPPEAAKEVPPGTALRVVLMWGSDEGAGWAASSMNHLAHAYAPEDSVYEKLIDDAAAR